MTTEGKPSFDIAATTRNIDGTMYNNYARYKGVSVNATDEGASSKTYEVWVSEDGNNFIKMTDMKSNRGERTDELTFSQAMDVRAVKLNCTSRFTNYVHSIYEIAFYGTSNQGKVVPILSNLQIRDYYRYSGKLLQYID